jgi:signal peptidase I
MSCVAHSDEASHGRSPGRGDVVVFKYPVDERRDFIKRVVGMPGDQIHVRGRQVIVNEVPVSEPYVMPPDGAGRGAEERCGYTYGCDPIVAPPNAYFLMGDNREHSQDSRNWGFVRPRREDRRAGHDRVLLVGWRRSLASLGANRTAPVMDLRVLIGMALVVVDLATGLGTATTEETGTRSRARPDGRRRLSC